MLRVLHIEGLPITVTAARLSDLMSVYGPVQYAEVSALSQSFLERVCAAAGPGAREPSSCPPPPLASRSKRARAQHTPN